MTQRFPSVAALLFATIIMLSTAVLAPPLGAAAAEEITKESFFDPGLAPVRKSGPYDVTIVYFMDYQCPACRKHSPDVARAFNEDRRVRVIYRDTPIFGPRSEAAARAAIASQFQGKHEAMHQALMQSEMPLDERSLRSAARKAGVDWDRLQLDLKKRGDEIDLQIARNMELSRTAGVAGTPAFIVGDYLANGVLDYEGMKGTIADARKDAGISAPAPQEPVAAAEPKDRAEEPEAFAGSAPDTEQLQEASIRDAEAVAFEGAPATPAPSGSPSGQFRSLWPWLVAIGVALATAAAAARFGVRRSS